MVCMKLGSLGSRGEGGYPFSLPVTYWWDVTSTKLTSYFSCYFPSNLSPILLSVTWVLLLAFFFHFFTGE